jgi:hypothetical protein
MDDAYIGGARSGRRGRGAAGKTPFVAAIATTDDGKASRIKSSFGPSKPSAVLRSECSQAARSSLEPTSSPTVWRASPLSPKPDASTPQ